MFTKIILGIIILHLVAGFGFIFWKISGPGKKSDDPSDQDENVF